MGWLNLENNIRDINAIITQVARFRALFEFFHQTIQQVIDQQVIFTASEIKDSLVSNIRWEKW